MEQYVLYESPKDYPGKWIVRRWFIKSGSVHPMEARIFNAYDQAVEWIPEDLVYMMPMPGDDPCIKGVWI